MCFVGGDVIGSTLLKDLCGKCFVFLGGVLKQIQGFLHAQPGGGDCQRK